MTPAVGHAERLRLLVRERTASADEIRAIVGCPTVNEDAARDVATAADAGAAALDEVATLRAERDRLRAALEALVAETERCDRPGLYGVGTDDDVMVAARAALTASPGETTNGE